MILILFRGLLFFLPLALLTSCSPRLITPIPTLEYTNPAARNNPKLLIFLRGRGSGNQMFENEGMVQAVIDRQLPFDMVAPDSHLGYLKSGSLSLRIHEDIIVPAKTRGYKEIWLAGVSMGGLGSWFILRDYPEDIDGIILISPFLGEGSTVAEIQSIGGIDAWNPGQDIAGDWEHNIWSFIKQYLGQTSGNPSVYLSYGTRDRFRNEQQELAKSLPAAQVLVLDGGHDNRTIKKLWLAQLVQLDEVLRR